MAKRKKIEEKDTTTQQAKQPQELFGKFVNNCIKGDGSLLTKQVDGGLFTVDNLKNTKEFLDKIINSNNSSKNKTSNLEETEDKYGVSNIFNVSDPLWKKEEYKNIQEIIIKILLHCYWLMYLGSDRLKTQIEAKDYYKKDAEKDYFQNIDRKWAIGQTCSRDPLGAMLKIVEMIIFLKEKLNKDEGIDINSTIIEYWSQKEKAEEKNSNVANIILYFCDTTHFLPIPSYDNKKKIYKNLGCIVENDSQQGTDFTDGMSELDKTLIKIKTTLQEIDENLKNNYPYSVEVTLGEENPFWHQDILPFWQDTNSSLKGELSLEDLLEYKKALVLYGPPGTSKSYSAREIAKHIIARSIKRKWKLTKEDIEGFIKTCDDHIHILQFHPNYTYDDFIIGKTIKSENVEVEEGWLLKLIDKINKDNKDTLPHIVILDEINRVDISRVFGELLTAMEPAYRGKDVELSVSNNKGNKFVLNVPNNMYFIGTMNQIDFSLEQVDFALRRRFIWQLSTYNKDTLEHIIETKNDGSINSSDIDDYCSRCTNLNNVIKANETLGESYWIGHTYFAEIIDIYKQIIATAAKKWDAAKNVLWQISIKPTLEAYCGTMDSKARESFITKCEEQFMPKEQKKNVKNDSTNTSTEES